MHYLPNKKFILIVVISLLIVGGGFFILKNYGSEKPRQITKQKLSSDSEPIIAQEINKDSDNDGLKDWEEVLWKTDPNNPDTDKDGTPDGQEIKEGRNPLIAGKNGKTDKIESPKPDEIYPLLSAAPSSLTEALGQQFFNAYLSLMQEGSGQISEQDKEALIASFLKTTDNFSQAPRELYVKSDIKIDSGENQNIIKEYGNNLALIIKKYFDPIPETEMTVFYKAMQNQDKSELLKLKPIASAYKKTSGEFLSLEAPESFSEKHLALINDFSDISQTIENMQKVLDDPVIAVSAISQYQKSSLEAYKILAGINDYFSENNIIFAANEPAELFKIYSVDKIGKGE